MSYGLGSIWDELRDLATAGLTAAAATIDAEIRRRITEFGVTTYAQLPPEVRADIERRVAAEKARELGAVAWPWMVGAGIIGAVVLGRLFRRRQ